MKKAFTMAGAGQGAPLTGIYACGHAFTMAEILLSLTIIGVVAAITLPSLTGNINERTWNTQRKALYARMSQAIALMPALNGYGTLTEESSAGASDAVDTATETFVTDGLAKVLKINNICDNKHLEDCGIPDKIIPINNSININLTDITTLRGLNSYFNSSAGVSLDTKAAAFETQNGESILAYYNPKCTAYMGETSYQPQSKMCANFIYDLNGKKGPNTVGKDIGFMTIFYPSDPVVVSPVPIKKIADVGAKQYTADALCRNLNSESRLPNKEELAAIFFNKQLYNNNETGGFWSNTVFYSSVAQMGWHQNFQINNGYLSLIEREHPLGVICIKR